MPHDHDHAHHHHHDGDHAHRSLIQTILPGTEPVVRADIKSASRIDDLVDTAENVAQDALIDDLIKAARKQAERHTRRQFIEASWRLQLDRFPGIRGEIELPISPLISVTQIQYIDESLVLQTLASNLFQVDSDSEPGRLRPAPDEEWPDTDHETIAAVRITFKAGYGVAPTDVPEDLKRAIIMIVGHWWEHREPFSDGPQVREVPFTANLLLEANRVFQFI